MPDIGCTTWCLLDHTLTDALEVIATRTHTIEILADATHDLLDNQDILTSHTFTLSVHSPTTDINIASVREPIRESSLSLLGEICKRAAELDARIVIVHPGFTPWLELKDRSYSALLGSLESLSLIQDEYGIPVAVENMGSWEVCHFRDPDLLPVIRENGLSFCLDIGHAHLNGMLMDFLSADRPDHLHLHDNSGVSDDHLALGKGSIDLVNILPMLPSESLRVLEMPHIEWYDESMKYLDLLNLQR
ncbi:MAG: sugar phosphate isomerase/epimerase family protein [Methanocalculus sp.]|uniref:sugar phosphate isomerase/epimerase family protein n=1 Tax=Methanocalculus sp. TaxID=2004547 RepID=UPI00271652D0|nr:sugar phosphate isomerase/epimerase family protein [Methanocalculus sp.]MDO9538568.1 sugar phosphate isomerase/epimerase family protein [Methanocalculus sp.]